MRMPRAAARMVALADRLHAEGRDATARHSHVEGTTLRYAANRIRAELGLAPLTYDGERPWEIRPGDGPIGPDPFLGDRDAEQICEECGNDLACLGYRYCSDCLETLGKDGDL